MRAPDRLRFVILARYRSGSTLLARTLRQHPSLSVHDEILNLNRLCRDPHLLEAPSSYLRRVFEAEHPPEVRAVGFKLMYQQATAAELDKSHWWPGPPPKVAAAIDAVEAHIRGDRSRHLRELEAIWDELRDDSGLRIVHVTRERYLASHVSFLLAMNDGLWIDTPYITRKLRVDPDGCRRWFESCRALSRHYSSFFASHPVLRMSYEDLTSRFTPALRTILEFLDVRPMPLPPATSRQRTRPLSELIDNYEDLKRAFEATEWSAQFLPEGD